MAVEWFCRVMGSDVGPLNQNQLIEMARQHQLNPEDLVRRNNSSWVPAFQVKGLFEAAAKPAPPPPPVPVVESTAETPETSPEPKGSRPVEKDSDAARRDYVASGTDGEDWFCIASGEKQGPLGFDELKSLVAQGRLRGRDRVWRGSWPKFRTAAEVEGLEAT